MPATSNPLTLESSFLDGLLPSGPQGGGIYDPTGTVPPPTSTPDGSVPGLPGGRTEGPTSPGGIKDIDGTPNPKALAEMDRLMGKGYKTYFVQGELRFENANGQVVGRFPKSSTPGLDTWLNDRTGMTTSTLGSAPRSFEGGKDANGQTRYKETPASAARNGGSPASPSAPGGSAAGGGSTGGGVSRGGSNVPSIEGGGSGTSSSSEGGIELGGGGGADSPPPIDPNAPLGLDFGGAAGSVLPGDQRYNDSSVFSTPKAFTEGLGKDASLNDILLGAMGEQRATRDAALGISGGLATGFENNPLRAQAEQNALSLGANPFSLDDRTIQRLQGQQGELIGRNAERLQQTQNDRAAAQGITRSGVNQAQNDRISINANRQLGDAQRGLLVEQATRRPQELASATNLVNDTLQQQQAARERIAGGAIGTLQNTDITGDAAILGTLAGGGTPQINRIATGPRSGPIGSIAYSGPSSLNPFR
jgi:hypothetical protein